MINHLTRRICLVTITGATLALLSGLAQADDLSRYDGVYSGQSAPAMAISGCGERSKDITIHVKHGEAWTHHHRLSGQVDASGNLSMQDSSGIVQVTGRIAADNLIATETAPETPKKLSGAYTNNGLSCSYTINASRG